MLQRLNVRFWYTERSCELVGGEGDGGVCHSQPPLFREANAMQIIRSHRVVHHGCVEMNSTKVTTSPP